MPKVSITMATYNVAPYLRESLDSVINQTFKDIEVIIIDDCSKDGTQEILKEYEQKDNRIHIVLRDKNEGLSVSRNIALSLAKGDYVTFVDGDDVIDLSLIEKSYNQLFSNNSEMVIWDYCTFHQSKQLPDIDKKTSIMVSLNPKDKMALLKRPGFIWTRMIKREVVDRLNLHFPEGMTKQDIPIHWKLVTGLDKIAILPERLYFYRVHPTATSARKDKSVFSLAYVMDIVKNQLIEAGIYDIYRNEFLSQRLNRLHGMYDYIKSEYKTDAKIMILDRLDADAIAFINSPSCILGRRTILFFKGFVMGNFFYKVQYDCFIILRLIYRKFKTILA